MAGARRRRRAGAWRERIDRLAADAGRLEGIGKQRPPPRTAELSADGTIGVLRIPLTELPGAVPHETGTALIDLAERRSRPTDCASSSAAS